MSGAGRFVGGQFVRVVSGDTSDKWGGATSDKSTVANLTNAAHQRPAGDRPREVILAEVECSDTSEITPRPVAVVIARVDATHAIPARIRVTRVRDAVRIPAGIVEPVGSAEGGVELDERRPVRLTHTAPRHRSQAREHREAQPPHLRGLLKSRPKSEAK